MRVKRFFAENMTEAIRLVRETLGEDAAILSTNRSEQGIEVVAAVEYDDSMFDQKANPLVEAYQQTPIKTATPTPTHTKLTQPKKTAPLKHRAVEDPALTALRNELKDMRELLQDDLAGLAWREKERETPAQAMVFRRLRQLGFSANLARRYAKSSNSELVGDACYRDVLAAIGNSLTTTEDDILTHGGIVALVGPTGVGKTTTIAKLAALYAKRHGEGKVALLTTDSYRIGAQDQLKVFGKLLDVPVRTIDTESSLRAALRSFDNKELILIDTAGMSRKDTRLNEQLKIFASKRLPVKTHLVLSSTCQRLVLESALKTFRAANIDAVIVTKIDEGISIGGLISLIIENDLPLSYITDGQKIPEDCHVAHGQCLISCASTMMMQAQSETDEKCLANAYDGREFDVDI